MSVHGVIRRYSLIIEKVSKIGFPSLKEIIGFIEDHGLKISDRTLQRDIEHIRYEFGMAIMYDQNKQGYYLDKAASRNDYGQFLRFFDIVNEANLLSESLSDSKDALQYISFESEGSLKGIEYLRSLLFAVRNRRIVTINYQRFQMQHSVHFKGEPILIKEYQSRWYIIVYISRIKEYRTLAVDRITSVEVSETLFDHRDNQELLDKLDDLIGVNHSAGKPILIQLLFTPRQANYVKSLSWHPSQKVIKEDESGCLVELFVIPNYELKQRILMMGDQVKVIQPEWLVDEIKTLIDRMLNQY